MEATPTPTTRTPSPSLIMLRNRLGSNTKPPPPQHKSNLKSLMEQFIVAKTKTNEALSALINQLNSKFNVMATHHKVMGTWIA